MRLPLWRRYLTVEPVIFFYAYGLITSLPIWQQYVYDAASQLKDFPYKNLTQGRESGGCGDDRFGRNSTLGQKEKEVRCTFLLVTAGECIAHALFNG